MLEFSESCERNKGPILDRLTDELRDCLTVLEIGSGTGQHAVHFATGLPRLEWQPTERTGELRPLAMRIEAEAPENVRPPLPLDVGVIPWPVTGPFDAVFTANTLHIMSWDSVRFFFDGVGRVLGERGLLCIYGPFLYEKAETVPSNVAFDQWLRNRDASSGIREFTAVDSLADAQALTLKADYPMPANNRLLVWQRA